MGKGRERERGSLTTDSYLHVSLRMYTILLSAYLIVTAVFGSFSKYVGICTNIKSFKIHLILFAYIMATNLPASSQIHWLNVEPLKQMIGGGGVSVQMSSFQASVIKYFTLFIMWNGYCI